MSGTEGNGESGVAHLAVPMMTITVDPRSGLPSFKCTAAPIAFWQMMVGEVMRQLEEQRRKGAALALQQALAQQRQDAAIADAVRRGKV